MKRKSIILCCIITATLSLSLTGCWNYREIDQLYMVSGFAVDKAPDGKFLITVEAVDIKTAGKEATFAPLILSAEGETLLDAIRNIIIISGRKLYWSHAKVIIIGQELAKEGIIPILDLISRDPEPRLELNVIISKERTAGEIFLLQSTVEKIQGFEIYTMVKSQKSLSKAPTIKAYQLVNSLSLEKGAAVLPVIGFAMNAGKKNIALSGAAVLKKEQLAGFLGEEDTKYLLFVRDEIKGGVLPEMKLSEASPKIISLEIFENKTQITPVYSNGKVSMNIEIKTKAAVDEHGTTKSYIDPENISVLKREAEKSLENNIKNTIRKVQEEYETDIFGFGNEIKIKMPSLWKSMEQDWDRLFPDLDVNVKASIDIRNTGITLKPLRAGE